MRRRYAPAAHGYFRARSLPRSAWSAPASLVPPLWLGGDHPRSVPAPRHVAGNFGCALFSHTGPSMTFADLPNDARLWVFAAVRRLEPAEVELLLTTVDRHVRGWLAHGHPVVGAHELRYGQFLLVGADERATGVSGCSIDGLFHVLQGLESELAVRLLDSTPVWYRNADGESARRPAPTSGRSFRTGRSVRKPLSSTTPSPLWVSFGRGAGKRRSVSRPDARTQAGRRLAPVRGSWHARAVAAAGSQ